MSAPSHHTPKTLTLLAPDGDFKIEGQRMPYPDVDAAWRASDNMGSRWVFYPCHVVTTPGGIIADVPTGMPEEWIGRRIRTLIKAFAQAPDVVCEWLNDQAPLPIFP